MAALYLSAKWKYLIMINYEIDPSVLTPYIPVGTQIDLWNGKAYISLVGFMFLDTRVQGVSIPFHRNFEEVNLRFYVKKRVSLGEEKRGVVFVKEIVPRWAIAHLARRLYNENYVSLPMAHKIGHQSAHVTAEYKWKFDGRWHQMQVSCKGDPKYPVRGSQAEFITEHYWGFSKQRNGSTMEYQVEHLPWRIWEGDNCSVDIDAEIVYGSPFAYYLERPPASAFLAEGSEIKVFQGQMTYNPN